MCVYRSICVCAYVEQNCQGMSAMHHVNVGSSLKKCPHLCVCLYAFVYAGPHERWHAAHAPDEPRLKCVVCVILSHLILCVPDNLQAPPCWGCFRRTSWKGKAVTMCSFSHILNLPLLMQHSPVPQHLLSNKFCPSLLTK